MASAFAGALLLTACAPNGGLAVDELEQELLALTLPERPGLVTSVACPGPLAPVAGNVITCEVTIGTQTAPLEVTFGEERGEILQAVVTARLVSMDDIEKMAGAALSSDLSQATQLRCPQPVMVVGSGESVRCAAIDASGVERELFVTPDDGGSVGLSFSE